MEDRVGDILAQRARLERGAGTAIALSLLLHGAMTAAAVYVSLRHPAEAKRSAISIKFAPVASSPAQRSRSRAATKPVAAPKTPAKIEEPKPRIEAPRPEPLKPTTAPVQQNTVPTNTFGKSTKKGSDAPPSPKPAAAPATSTDVLPPGAVTAADVPIGGSGVTGLEGGDFPYTLYIDRMRTLIGSRWFRPQVTGGTTTTVSFTILRDGTIRDCEIETPSGNSTFDRAARRAVLESSPLPPLPFAYNGTYLGVHLTFK
jgi:TonB family protein